MNLWIKIENFLNRVLGFLFGGLGNFLRRLTPDELPKLYAQISSTCIKFISLIRTRSKSAALSVKNNSKNSFEELKKLKGKSLSLNLKEEMKGKNPLQLVSKPFQLMGHKLTSMEPKHALGFMAISAFLTLSIFGIVFSSSRIYEKTRLPASIKEASLPGRPVYYKIDQKQVNFATVKVPIYAMGKNDIKFVTADFDLQMSNRLSVIYIREHETQIRDHLINNVEPMDPIFTMEQEGKRVIKDKLKKEINVFLKNHDVQGAVDDINIIYLLGS